MPTYDELAKVYAERIQRAISADGFKLGEGISDNDLRLSNTLSEAKSVKRDIDNLVHTTSKTPLSEDNKRSLIVKINQELGLGGDFYKSHLFIESASNDDLSDLADEIENILSGSK